MREDLALLDLLFEMFRVVAISSIPLLLGVLLAGIAVGVFQAVTSIQDAAFGQIARLVAGGLVLVLSSRWILNLCMNFMETVYSDFGVFLQIQG